MGRVLWALSDPTGLPAKRFAEISPAPSIEWLGPLSDGKDWVITTFGVLGYSRRRRKTKICDLVCFLALRNMTRLVLCI